MKPRAQYYTSPLSEFCAEKLNGDFHYLDGDEVMFRHSAQPMTYARETGTLLVLESKFPGEEIRRSQRETFPLLAAALSRAADANLIARASGVYVIEGEPPFIDGATVLRVRGAKQPGVDWQSIGVQFDWRHRFNNRDLCNFIRCRA